MTVIPVSQLHRSDLALLGPNVAIAARRDHRACLAMRFSPDDQLEAINRSLAGHGEEADLLTVPAPAGR